MPDANCAEAGRLNGLLGAGSRWGGIELFSTRKKPSSDTPFFAGNSYNGPIPRRAIAANTSC